MNCWAHDYQCERAKSPWLVYIRLYYYSLCLCRSSRTGSTWRWWWTGCSCGSLWLCVWWERWVCSCSRSSRTRPSPSSNPTPSPPDGTACDADTDSVPFMVHCIALFTVWTVSKTHCNNAALPLTTGIIDSSEHFALQTLTFMTIPEHYIRK